MYKNMIFSTFFICFNIFCIDSSQQFWSLLLKITWNHDYHDKIITFSNKKTTSTCFDHNFSKSTNLAILKIVPCTGEPPLSSVCHNVTKNKRFSRFLALRSRQPKKPLSTMRAIATSCFTKNKSLLLLLLLLLLTSTPMTSPEPQERTNRFSSMNWSDLCLQKIFAKNRFFRKLRFCLALFSSVSTNFWILSSGISRTQCDLAS